MHSCFTPGSFIRAAPTRYTPARWTSSRRPFRVAATAVPAITRPRKHWRMRFPPASARAASTCGSSGHAKFVPLGQFRCRCRSQSTHARLARTDFQRRRARKRSRKCAATMSCAKWAVDESEEQETGNRGQEDKETEDRRQEKNSSPRLHQVDIFGDPVAPSKPKAKVKRVEPG